MRRKRNGFCVVIVLATGIILKFKSIAFLLFIGNCSTISNNFQCNKLVHFSQWIVLVRLGHICCLFQVHATCTGTLGFYKMWRCVLYLLANWRKRNLSSMAERKCNKKRKVEIEETTTKAVQHALGIAFCKCHAHFTAICINWMWMARMHQTVVEPLYFHLSVAWAQISYQHRL